MHQFSWTLSLTLLLEKMDFKLFFIHKGCYIYASLVKSLSDVDDLISMFQGKNKTSYLISLRFGKKWSINSPKIYHETAVGNERNWIASSSAHQTIISGSAMFCGIRAVGSIHGDVTLVWLWSLFGNMMWSCLLVGPNSWETTLS